MTSTTTVPVVAIGASAGGLEAIRQVLGHVPDGLGMAFVVIQHLDPRRPSMLAEVLGSNLPMSVVEATDGMVLEPNHVYVIPPGADLGLRAGALLLVDREPGRGLHLPIDAFFSALAELQPRRSIGIVLSGSGSDGTEGLRALQAAGGITFAQDPTTAQFSDMPESAIAAGVVDFYAAPAELGEELGRIGQHPYLVFSPLEERDGEVPSEEEEPITAILGEVLRHAQVDFKGYKRSTIERRIRRRMALCSAASLGAYATLLHDDPDEARALAREVFIHVTSFFRDSAAFALLEQEIVPRIVERKGDGADIRVWVPGCSTGQEAYSIAMVILELFERRDRSGSLKVFGSDVSASAIAVARAGVYTERELAGVSQERRSRYFDRVDGNYRVAHQVREACVFATHDLTRDPPFARLDLISCRNLLIYFDTELQRRILPMLHHSLETHGYLFLGRSESVGASSDLFVPVDRQHRFFCKIGESPRREYPTVPGGDPGPQLDLRTLVPRRVPSREVQRQADHLLLARYAPPGAIINERLEVVQFRGRTGPFLEPPPGEPQMNILRMAREGLVGHLHDAIEEAKAKLVTVRREHVQIIGDEARRVIGLEIVPLAGLAETERHFLVLFEDAEAREAAPQQAARAPAAMASEVPPLQELRRVEAELAATRDYLQVALAEHQYTAQDLAAANEEMVAANEELQATNEELESAKEELQSTNEELTVVNDELRNRNEEVVLVAADLEGVLESVEIPVIIVDRELRIRRFTPVAREISWILPTDVGRSLEEVKLKVEVSDLAQRIQSVVQGGASQEWELQTHEGRWLRLRVRPYQTASHRIEGAILSFVDVDTIRRALQVAERSRDNSRAVVETMPNPVLVLDEEARIVSANHAFCRSFELTPVALVGVPLFELAAGAWDVPELHEALEEIVAKHTTLRNVELEIALPNPGPRVILVSGSFIVEDEGGQVVLALEDVTERRQLEASERDARIAAEQANRAKDLFLATLSHELRTPLSTILISAQVLDSVVTQDHRIQRATAAISRALTGLTRLIDDLLDISRIVSGKLMLELEAVDLSTVVLHAAEVLRPLSDAKNLRLELHVHESVGFVHGDTERLKQVVANLLGNAIKFTPSGGTITVRLQAIDGKAELTVSDTGIGVRPDVLPSLFHRFVQAEDSMARRHGGLGLGLAIVQHLVHVHKGEVSVTSPGLGKGTTFRVTLPLVVPNVTAALATPVASSAGTRSIQGIRVLLIEDDDDARAIFATMLEALGADVCTASSVAEGLAAVDGAPPQVILCDIAIPTEDGYAFLHQLRGRGPEHGGAIPVAAFTALASKSDRERILSAGFQMHLTKPLDADSLAAAVGDLAAMGPVSVSVDTLMTQP